MQANTAQENVILNPNWQLQFVDPLKICVK